MEHIILDETASTNTYIASHETELEAPVMIRAICQTAGRGQRGNFWESAPGENITASVLFHPEKILPRQQFAISEAIALAVVDTLAVYDIEARVKWPNDIYVGDCKICGILIEHSLMGSEIRRSIIGIGLNVNQKQFLSDAPNPVSMEMITGKSYDISEIAVRLGEALEKRMALTSSSSGRDRLHSSFMDSLWRGKGQWAFTDTASGEIFRASILEIAPDGILSLREEKDGKIRHYAFKEVSFKL